MSIDVDFTTVISDEEAAEFAARAELLLSLVAPETQVTPIDRERVQRLCQQTADYSFPAGQAQAGIQLGGSEVPKLLAEIDRLQAVVSLLAGPSIRS